MIEAIYMIAAALIFAGFLVMLGLIKVADALKQAKKEEGE